MKHLTIVVATHKQYWMPEDDVYLPVQVGAAGKSSISGFQRDDEGDNISDRNPFFCELTGLYWAWKNLDSDYMGLVHYRRYFEERLALNKQKRIASGAFLVGMLKKYDVILPIERNYFIESNYTQYVHAHHEEDLIAVHSVIADKYPDYIPYYDIVMSRSHGHRFNMFIMRKDLFSSYCGWLFDILFELERRLDISTYSANDSRVFGFVSERLLDLWIEKNNIVYGSLPVVHLENQHWVKKALSFLERKYAKRSDVDVKSTTVSSKKIELSDSSTIESDTLSRKPLVSVIIPVYNLQDCIDYCFQSIRSQTYDNIEILFVNDGSTDGSAQILDSFTEVDSRVTVLHKGNGGLSSARNYGILHASGEFAVYVDGDDYVAPTMIEELLNALSSTEADMAIGTGVVVSNYGQPFSEVGLASSAMNAHDASVVLLYGIPGVSAWCKLAPTAFWKSHLFDEGHVYEDLRMMFSTIADCKKIAIVESKLYAYVMRPGSITSSKVASHGQVQDYIDAICNVRDCFAGEKDEEILKALECRLANEYARLYRHVDYYKLEDSHYEAIRQYIVRYEKDHAYSVIRNKRLNRIARYRVALLAMLPSIYVPAFRFAARIRGKRLA